ncbi:MAG: transporter substrate-binding domain-containing protein [Flavobacteriales bacterium]|nr:transporter substrate-binding domain-containing protein [Flavobacteriales bacterium]
MTKKISYILILVLSISLFSCKEVMVNESKLPRPVKKDLKEIRADGKIKALINYSATSYFIYRGQPMGFEYELLNQYAKSQGVELEVIPIKNMDSVFIHLNNGVGDLVAANLTVTLDRKKQVDFSQPILFTKQVLVQRKPENWKKLSKKSLKDSLLNSPLELGGKTIYVRRESSFYERLYSLSKEIGEKIKVEVVPGEVSMEQLIEQVAQGTIDYTVADKNIALVNEWQYPNIDARVEVSNEQQIAFALRKNSDSLTASINNWLKAYQKTVAFKLLYKKYYDNRSQHDKRINDESFTMNSGQLTPYDETLKKYAPQIPWDWELVAALIYQESKFNNSALGWGNSFGVMQFMPLTGAKYGVDSTSSAQENIKAGVKYIRYLSKMWEDKITDSTERVKYVLASYNVGPGHVFDAYRLAQKYNKNPQLWKDVSYFLKNKSKPKYYKDEVVKHGYCKGHITYKYVKEIMERYQHYKTAIETHQEVLVER